MNTNRRHAVAALTAAGLLWGTTVPLSKLALQWLDPGWLTVLRFGLAAAVLLPVARRRGQRILEMRVLLSGAAGYGGVGHRAERRDHPDQRHPRGPADRGGAGAGRGHRRGMAPGRGPAGRVAGLRDLAGRGGPGHRGRRRRAARACAATAWYWPRWCCRPRSPWRRPGCCPAAIRSRSPRCSSSALRWARWPSPWSPRARPRSPAAPGPVLAVAALALAGTLAPFTLFAYGQSRVPAGRRGVPQHRAAGRRPGRDRVLRRPGGPEAAGRRAGRRRRHRAEQPHGLRPGAGRAGSGRRARAGRGRSWPDASRGR